MKRKKSSRPDRYEALYAQLLEQAERMHLSNKRRISRGLWGLLAMPVVLAVLRVLTDSSRVAFLLAWVLGMFVLCVYLIGVEYLDHQILTTLSDVTRREAEFDELLPELPQGPILRRIEQRMEQQSEQREAGE